MTKIYELTTNEKDGFAKYLVRGVKDDEQGKLLAKRVFRKYAWIPGVTYYADVGKSYGGRKVNSMTIKHFLKLQKQFRH